MAVVLINNDNTVNYIGDKLHDWLCLDGVTVEEIKDKTPAQVMGGIPDVHCVWDSEHRAVRDDRKYPHLVRKIWLENLTHEELVARVEANRKAAYANAQTGSDRLFAEAQRMQMMGLSGWEEVRDAAVARYEEIKLEHPWPVKES